MEELNFDIEHGELVFFIKDLVEITRNTPSEKVVFSTEAQRKIYSLFDEFDLCMIDQDEMDEGMMKLRFNALIEKESEDG